MKAVGALPEIRSLRNKLPSLEDLCVQSAIDNLQYLGDVGQTDLSLLRKILPHCTPEQLHRIETLSSGRDLSSVTDELWRTFYVRKFGPENVKVVVERMKKRRISFKWQLLYQAKLREQEEVQKKCVDRLKQLYVEADIQKQSRQIQLCSKVPPTSKRRRCEPGGNGSANRFANVKGRLMKKARLEFAASNECKNATMRNRLTTSKIIVPPPRRLVSPCPQKMPTPTQNSLTLHKMPTRPTLEKDLSNNPNSSKRNSLLSTSSTKASESRVEQMHKRKIAY